MSEKLTGKKILVTGGAGFIGSNLCEYFLKNANQVVCLDNLSTGKQQNIDELESYSNFRFIKGDICNMDDCTSAVEGVDHVFHQAALGSVPRSIKDPVATNRTNIDGFLNMLVATRDAGIRRFIYAASSSTYGDSTELPKVENRIGKPLSPYAITKYVNELYADVFARLYGMETIGLRYFNVFGRRQDPHGAYAAVIPLWVKSLLNHESPVINGDGSYSRDFTYIDNVLHANELAAIKTGEEIIERAKTTGISLTNYETVSEVFNVAYGGNTTLNELLKALTLNLSKFDQRITGIKPIYGPEREGDIPHSHASVDKARKLLGYSPEYDSESGFAKACGWYFENLKGV